MVDTPKRFRQNLLLLIGSTVLSAILVEVVLRIVLPAPIMWKFPQEEYQYDAGIGHWLVPNQHAFTHDKAVSTNSVGIRDAEYSKGASRDAYRILALGDSQTFGNGLELTDTWPKQLQANLIQASTGKRFEVLNCGLPASDTWQHEIILARLLASYEPDVVVLAFYVNDVVKRYTPVAAQNSGHVNAHVPISFLLKKSVLLLTLRSAWESAKHKWSPNTGFLLQQALVRGEDSPEIAARWAQVDRSLAAMKNLADKQNVGLLIASLPRRDQVDGSVPWEAYNEHLLSITARHQMRVINVFGPLQESYEQHGKAMFIPWDGHNSAIANGVIATEIAKAVQREM